MTTVNETRMRISLIDNMSSTITSMNRNMDSFTRSIQGVGTNGATTFSKMNKEVANLNLSVKGLAGALSTLRTLYGGIDTVVNGFNALFGSTMQYAKSMQTNQIGIAGILSSMTKVNGKQLEWNDSLELSKDIVKKLRVESLQTAATAEDLIGTFRAILGPGLAAGMKMSEIMSLTTVGVSAVKSLGLKDDQLIQELRDLVQGGIRPASSTLATSLGITDADIKKAKESTEGLYKFLMDKMKGYAYSTKDTASTMYGQLEILKQAYLDISTTVGEKFFGSYSKTLEKINNFLLVKDEKTNKNVINNNVIKFFEGIGQFADTVFNKLADASKLLFDNINNLFDFAKIMLLAQALNFAGERFKNILTSIAETKTAFSSYNRALEGCVVVTNALGEANARVDAKLANSNNIAKFYDGLIADHDSVKTNQVNYNKGLLRSGISSLGDQGDSKKLEAQIKKIETLSITANKRYAQAGTKAKEIAKQLVECGYSQAEANNQAIKILQEYTKKNTEGANKIVEGIEREIAAYKKREAAILNGEGLYRQQIKDTLKSRRELESRAQSIVASNDREAESLKKLKKEHREYISELRKKKVPTEQIMEVEKNYAKTIHNIALGLDTASKAHERYSAKLNDVKSKTKTFLSGLNSGIDAMNKFTGILSAAGGLLLTFGDSQDKTTQKTAEWLFGIDAAITSLGTLCSGLQSAVKWWKEYKKANDIAGLSGFLAKYGLTLSTAGIVGVGAAFVGGAVYSGYKDWEHAKNGGQFMVDPDDPERVIQVPINWDERYAKQYGQIHEGPEEEGLRIYDPKTGKINADDLEVDKNEDPNQKAINKYEKVQDSYEALIATIKNTTYALNDNSDAYTKNMLQADKQITSWQKTYNAWLREGNITEDQYKVLEELAAKYRVEMERVAELAQRQQDLSRSALREEQARLTIAMGGNQAQEYVAVNQELYNRKMYLEQALQDEKNTFEQRIELQKQYAATVKAIRDNDMYDMKSSWKAALTEISQQQVNFGESIKSVFSSVQSAGEQLLTSTGSFMERVANFFNSITQSILENMAKMIMQGLITNAILSAFGGGASINLNGTKSLTSGLNTLGVSNSAYSGNVGINILGHAKGGIANGWSIVGEQGPELVNFSNPGRVYTAQQTANALGGGATNIKIELKNESGQQMKAETTGTRFDGESYIVGVVLKAISNNQNGMRNIIKGVATT